MAETSETPAAPAITQGQTTAVGEGTHTSEAQPQVLEGEAAPAKTPSIWENWLLWAVVAMWLWWLFGSKKRRQQKAAEKKEAERRNTLEKGDKLVTIGRMHGTVVAFTDDTVTLKPDPKSDYTMTFDRQAIFRILPRKGEEVEQSADGKSGS